MRFSPVRIFFLAAMLRVVPSMLGIQDTIVCAVSKNEHSAQNMVISEHYNLDGDDASQMMVGKGFNDINNAIDKENLVYKIQTMDGAPAKKISIRGSRGRKRKAQNGGKPRKNRNRKRSQKQKRKLAKTQSAIKRREASLGMGVLEEVTGEPNAIGAISKSISPLLDDVGKIFRGKDYNGAMEAVNQIFDAKGVAIHA